jgi:hypothetical protein
MALGPTRPLALNHSMFVVDPKRSRLARHRSFFNRPSTSRKNNQLIKNNPVGS